VINILGTAESASQNSLKEMETKEKKTRGGARKGAGRKTKSVDGSRTPATAYLSPDNYAFRKELGVEWNDLLNEILNKFRNDQAAEFQKRRHPPPTEKKETIQTPTTTQ
jgi:hypothetical protein